MSVGNELKSWKNSFDGNGFDPERPNYPLRIDLTLKQKDWVRRAWTWASVALLGMKTPCIPDAIPRFTCDGRMYYAVGEEIHQHHIEPVGESLRLFGRSDYNRPDNIAPVNALIHVGKGVRPGHPLENEVIHEDTMEARWRYGDWIRAGKTGKSPMQLMHDYREEHTKRGEIYHNPLWDNHLRDLTQRVSSGYISSHPNDPWPSRKR